MKNKTKKILKTVRIINTNKLFVVRKYIMAKSAKEVIKKDKTTPIDDIYIDEDWKNGSKKQLESAIGFDCRTENEYEYEQ